MGDLCIPEADDGTASHPGATVAYRLQGRPEMYWPVNRALPLRQSISAYPCMPGRPLFLSLCAGIAYVALFMSHRLGEVWPLFLLGALILLTDAYTRGSLRACLNLLLHGRGPVPWYDHACSRSPGPACDQPEMT